MAEQPAGWRRVRFSEMVNSAGATRKSRGWSADDAGTDRYVGLEHLDPHFLRIRRWGDPEDVGENSDLRPFRAGDVILARRGIELRKVGCADFDGVASGHALVFSAKAEVMLPELLPFFVQSDLFMQRADRRSVGSLSRTVNLSALLKEEFYIPPLDEQRRLARAFAAANETAEETRSAICAWEAARDAATAHVLENGLQSAARQETELGARPVGWDIAPIDRRYDVQLGKMLSRKNQGTGVRRPYLRNANVDWGRLDLDDVAEMDFRSDELDRYELRPGDIVACEGRHVGKSAIWNGQVPGMCYQKALHRLRCRDRSDVPEFMLHTLRHYSVSGRLLRHTTGSTIPHLPLANLRAIKVAFPPREEQLEIVGFLNELDESRQRLGQRLRSARELLDSIAAHLWGPN